MKKKRFATIEEISSDAPPLSAIEALRRNLLYAMFKGVTEDDMGEIVARQVKKAKAGDTKSAKLIMDLAKAGDGLSSGASSIHMQQAVLVSQGNEFLSDLRRNLVILLAFEGPHLLDAAANRLRVPATRISEALDSPWFELEQDGWHLTHQGRREVLELPQVQPPREVPGPVGARDLE